MKIWTNYFAKLLNKLVNTISRCPPPELVKAEYDLSNAILPRIFNQTWKSEEIVDELLHRSSESTKKGNIGHCFKLA